VMRSHSISKAYGLFAKPEIDELKRVVRTLPGNLVAVVLGSGPGTATIAMFEARPTIRVYSVDVVDANIERLHAQKSGFMQRLVQIKGRSAQVGLEWQDPLIDLLFVDAHHTYDAVKADNKAWLPHLRDGGITWYHDYGTENSMWLEVKKAVDEDMLGQEQVAKVCSSIAFRWSVVDATT